MRLVILTFESLFADFITSSTLSLHRDRTAGVMCSTSLIAGKSLLASASHILGHGGLTFPVLKGTELAVTKVALLAGRIGLVPNSCTSVPQRCRNYGIPVASVTDVNSTEAVAQIREWRPDLIVSIYFNHRIGPEVLAIPAIGTLNVHGAVLPGNRGMFPYFWALCNGDDESGSTVHWVDENFDTGDVVLQSAFPIEKDDTAVSVQAKSARVGADLLAEALRLIQAGTAPRIAQDESKASYNSWPTRDDARRFRAAGRRYGSIGEIWRCATGEMVAP